MAAGLDADDYQDVFLGVWTKRNVWAERHPVRHAGEVIATTDFITRAEVERSEMYADYLRQRDLHQGLRLSTWCGEGWVNDISLIRSWSAGEFTAEERRMAEWLIPHLRRAVEMAYAIRTASLLLDGAEQLDQLEYPAMLLTVDGTMLRHNAAAEQMARDGDRELVAIAAEQLRNGTAHCHRDLPQSPITRAGHLKRNTSTLSGRDKHDRPYKWLVLPVSARRIWPIPVESAVLLLAFPAEAPASLSGDELNERYGLTPAEAALALQFADGATVAIITERTGRSTNTVRTHLHRILQKTGSRRQADLVRLVLGQSTAQPPLGSKPIFSVDKPR